MTASHPAPAPSPFHYALIAADGPRMMLTTFSILALELAMIRWVGTQIRVAAYFSNLVLIAAFLGIGLGAAIGPRRPQWFAATLPILVVVVGVLSLSEPFGFVRFAFPDPTINLWGATIREQQKAGNFLLACLAVLASFWAITAVFFAMGLPLGWLFSRMEPLRAYRWDIAGSLLGVVVMSIAAWAGTPPPVWFTIAVVPVLLLHRTLINLLCAGAVVIAAAYSMSGAVFSPYNRIDIVPAVTRLGKPALERPEWELSVNRDYHQYMFDLSHASDPGAVTNETRDLVRASYEVPFRVSDKQGSAMIVGAGTGNDDAAALRAGFRHVVSVDIDPRIIALGRAMHPERPYDDPRVVPVVNDARAWFEQNNELFDVVCYGLLDSHAMFSAMSTLRLDNYVYTIEGVRAGWAHVAPDGVLSISFSVAAGEWMVQRLTRVIEEATGIEPIIVDHRYNFGVTFLVGRMVTELSLLFGSTWIVNSCVIAGILVMIMLANTLIEHWQPRKIEFVYAPLTVSLLLIWTFSAGVLNRFDVLPRAALAGLIYSLPVFFAGMIFSTSLKRARDTSAALGANLCGAVSGGLLEYLSMLTGMKALTLLALALYLASKIGRASCR